MQLLTLSQMADRVNRSTKTFRKYVLEYDVPHVRMGRDLLFDEQKVLDHLELLTEQKKQKRAALAVPRKTVSGRGRFAEALGL